MATLVNLEKSGALVRFEASLRADEFPERTLFMSPEFRDWLDGPLAEAPKTKGRPLTPYEQVVDDVFTRFVAGRELHLGTHLYQPMSRGEHVWALKTTDTRLFGFFYRPRQFIVHQGGIRSELKRKDYEERIRGVIQYRKQLPLKKPKFHAVPTEKFRELL